MKGNRPKYWYIFVEKRHIYICVYMEKYLNSDKGIYTMLGLQSPNFENSCYSLKEYISELKV